jgi:hypothetical protein
MGGTHRFTNASGAVTLTMTVVPVLAQVRHETVDFSDFEAPDTRK